VSIVVPTVLRHAVGSVDGGPAWLASLEGRLARAIQRWDLMVDAPFESGMAAWTAPARTTTGEEVVLKLSFPHLEGREEAAALAAWNGSGAAELLGADAEDQALLLRRLRPGTSLRDAALPIQQHLAVGAEVLGRMAAVVVPADGPFQDLAAVATDLAATADERLARLGPLAPYPIDRGLCRHAVDLLRTLPSSAERRGLAHGDLNPGNILSLARPDGATVEWVAIDPKPVHGDLAWDPWPLLTQVGDWLTVVPSAGELAGRTRLVAAATGLDPARVAAWGTARGIASGLWAADHGWWSGFRRGRQFRRRGDRIRRRWKGFLRR